MSYMVECTFPNREQKIASCSPWHPPEIKMSLLGKCIQSLSMMHYLRWKRNWTSIALKVGKIPYKCQFPIPQRPTNANLTPRMITWTKQSRAPLAHLVHTGKCYGNRITKHESITFKRSYIIKKSGECPKYRIKFYMLIKVWPGILDIYQCSLPVLTVGISNPLLNFINREFDSVTVTGNLAYRFWATNNLY